MAEGTGAGALAPEVFLIAHGQMDETAFAAAHRAEAERSLRLPDPLANRERPNSQLLLAQEAIVIGVEAEQGVLIRRHFENFLSELFQSEESLALVVHQEFEIRTGELDDERRLLKVAARLFAIQDLVLDVEVHGIEDCVKKIGDIIAHRFDCVFPVAHRPNRFCFLFLLRNRRLGEGGLGAILVKEVLLDNANHVTSEPV